MRLRSAGRGGGYSVLRGISESLLGPLYAGGWPGRAWGRVPGRSAVRLVHHRLALLPPGSADLRVAFASDLHIGPTTPPELLANAAALLAAAAPHALLLGGDYVFLDASPATGRALGAWVRAVGAPVVYAVLGNHDLWTAHTHLERALAAVGARVLVNEAVRLGPITVVGLDDPWTGRPDAEAALAGSRGPRVGLVHAPEGVAPLLGRVELILCGHTHGGQIAAPGGRPILVPGPAGRRWPHGRHALDGTTLLVSRGLGGVEVPVRAWAPPDVLLVELVAVCSPPSGV